MREPPRQPHKFSIPLGNLRILRRLQIEVPTPLCVKIHLVHFGFTGTRHFGRSDVRVRPVPKDIFKGAAKTLITQQNKDAIYAG